MEKKIKTEFDFDGIFENEKENKVEINSNIKNEFDDVIEVEEETAKIEINSDSKTEFDNILEIKETE